MTQVNLPRIAYVAAVSLIGLALLSATVTSQSTVEGLIKARNGETMVVENTPTSRGLFEKVKEMFS